MGTFILFELKYSCWSKSNPFHVLQPFYSQHKLRSNPLCLSKQWLREIFHIESLLTLCFTINSSGNLPTSATLGSYLSRPHVGTHFPLYLFRAILGPWSTVVSPAAFSCHIGSCDQRWYPIPSPPVPRARWDGGVVRLTAAGVEPDPPPSPWRQSPALQPELPPSGFKTWLNVLCRCCWTKKKRKKASEIKMSFLYHYKTAVNVNFLTWLPISVFFLYCKQ